MTTQQERLSRDISELEEYITNLRKRGRTEIIPKITKKINYLKTYMAGKEAVNIT